MNYNVFHKKTKSQNKIIEEDNFTYHLILSVLNQYLKSDSKVLDIGCGAGTLCLYLASKGNKVLGIDISKKAVSNANVSARKLRLKNVKFEVVNFPKRSPEGEYDFIIFTEVIEHLKDENKALQTINKLLSRGGFLFISTPSENAPLYRIGYAKKFDTEVGHLRRYNSERLRNLLTDSGFKIEYINKNEGIIRNFLFLNPVAGKSIRFLKSFVGRTVTAIDNLTIPVFGESDIMIVAKKI